LFILQNGECIIILTHNGKYVNTFFKKKFHFGIIYLISGYNMLY
jgi:hypothetical protein